MPKEEKEEIWEPVKVGAEYAKQMAKEAAKKEEEALRESSKKLVEYLNSKYPQKIKEAIAENYYTESVSIFVPKKYKKTDKMPLLEKILNDEYKSLGFRISVRDDGCRDCIFSIICNRKSFKITFRWG